MSKQIKILKQRATKLQVPKGFDNYVCLRKYIQSDDRHKVHYVIEKSQMSLVTDQEKSLHYSKRYIWKWANLMDEKSECEIWHKNSVTANQ